QGVVISLERQILALVRKAFREREVLLGEPEDISQQNLVRGAGETNPALAPADGFEQAVLGDRQDDLEQKHVGDAEGLRDLRYPAQIGLVDRAVNKRSDRNVGLPRKPHV